MKKKYEIGLILAGFLSFSNIIAQKTNQFEARDKNNVVLDFAWTGGMNAPQFSEIDLNGDAIQDLFVFDREGNRVLTFLNGGTTGQVDYIYAPEYESKFPVMTDWALLVDYNYDGKNDIFTSMPGGIKVYKNTSSGSSLTFKLEVFPYLTSYNPGGGNSNIYVNSQDIPAITDVDFDGDIDILAFGLNSNQVSFYENYAKDSGDVQTFKFHDNTYCWCWFREDPLSNFVTLNDPCAFLKSKESKSNQNSKSDKHSGASMLAFDPDHDMDMDLTLGDPGFPNLVFLENGMDKNFCKSTSQDTSFPIYDTPVDIQLFPAAYYIDVNNDGKKDLLVAPNGLNGIENYKGVWYYKNTGTASNDIFTYQTDDFLQASMIDLGSYSYPVLFDYNFDGLMDLVVGNGGYFQRKKPSIHSLALYENKGSNTNPIYVLIDDDYAGISKINLNTTLNVPSRNLVPCFGDINSDGNIDMLIGDYEGKLHYFQNEPVGGVSNFVLQEVNYKSIDVGSFASPFFVDLDEDGLLDIVSGKQNGKLNYYRNIGTRFAPDFDSLADDSKLGNVNTKAWNDFDGYSQARFYRSNQNLFLISGSKRGTIYRYGNILGNLTGNFTLLDTLYIGIDEGNRSHVEIGDIDNDGDFEFITGNARGGLSIYLSDEIVGVADLGNHSNYEDWQMNISRLTGNLFLIKTNSSQNGIINVYSITGQELNSQTHMTETVLDLSNFQNGIYLVSVKINDVIKTQKLILSK